MSENQGRLEQIERELIQLKKTPLFLKANAAEAIIEKTVYLLRCVVADLEELKK